VTAVADYAHMQCR